MLKENITSSIDYTYLEEHGLESWLPIPMILKLDNQLIDFYYTIIENMRYSNITSRNKTTDAYINDFEIDVIFGFGIKNMGLNGLNITNSKQVRMLCIRIYTINSFILIT
jgi:hypothetical protein